MTTDVSMSFVRGRFHFASWKRRNHYATIDVRSRPPREKTESRMPSLALSPLSALYRTTAALLTAVVLTTVGCSSNGPAPDPAPDADEPRRFGGEEGILLATFHNNGTNVRTGPRDVHIKIADLETGRTLRTVHAGEILLQVYEDGGPENPRDRLTFSHDLSHVAYLRSNGTDSPLLIYRIDGPETEAELVRTIEAPVNTLSDELYLDRPTFHPERDELWYSVTGGPDSTTDTLVHSVPLDSDDEPVEEVSLEFSSWRPDPAGEPVRDRAERRESIVDGYDTTSMFHHGEKGTEALRSVRYFDHRPFYGGSVGIYEYSLFHPFEDGKRVLAGGGYEFPWSTAPEEGEWGMLVVLTVEDGEVVEHETVVERREGLPGQVTSMHVLPGEERAVVAFGTLMTSDHPGRYFLVDLNDPENSRELAEVEDPAMPSTSIMGLVEG